mmetsp:Transcript_18829/g.38592  ORF Transcript_18829/g.38592 Transcript_18829/m.38592 type:complete len:319 (-) Transcript_18829:1595-2551(-)
MPLPRWLSSSLRRRRPRSWQISSQRATSSSLPGWTLPRTCSLRSSSCASLPSLATSCFSSDARCSSSGSCSRTWMTCTSSANSTKSMRSPRRLRATSTTPEKRSRRALASSTTTPPRPTSLSSSATFSLHTCPLSSFSTAPSSLRPRATSLSPLLCRAASSSSSHPTAPSQSTEPLRAPSRDSSIPPSCSTLTRSTAGCSRYSLTAQTRTSLTADTRFRRSSLTRTPRKRLSSSPCAPSYSSCWARPSSSRRPTSTFPARPLKSPADTFPTRVPRFTSTSTPPSPSGRVAPFPRASLRSSSCALRPCLTWRLSRSPSR